MCGLAGVLSSTMGIQDLGVFEDLMIISTLRGRDGSGIIAIDNETSQKLNKNNPVAIAKYTGCGAALVNTNNYKSKVYNRKKSAVIGHCRYPTKGANTPDMIHPHVHGPLAGVHNGTMWSVSEHFIKDNESDSSALFKSIHEKGLEETVNKSSGAYALVWIDNELETINFIRNDQRPLWFAQNFKTMPDTIFWASEKAHLELALWRHGLRGYDLSLLPENEHWSTLYQPEKGIDFTKQKVAKKYYTHYRNDYGTEFQRGWVTDPETGKQQYRHLTKEERDAGKHFETFRQSDSLRELVREAGTGEERSLGTRSRENSTSKTINLNILEREQNPKLPAIIGQGSRGTSTSGVGSAFRYAGLNRDTKMDEFKNKLQEGLADLLVLQAEEDRNTVIPFRNTRETGRNRHASRLSKAERKRRKLAARNFRDGHNAGHLNFLATLPNYYVSRDTLVNILHSGCEYCGQPSDMVEYDRGGITFVTRSKFLCSECSDIPDAIHLCEETYQEFRSRNQEFRGRRKEVTSRGESFEATCERIERQYAEEQEAINTEYANNRKSLH